MGSNDRIKKPTPLILDDQRREVRAEPHQISIGIIPFPQFLRLELGLGVEVLWGLMLLESEGDPCEEEEDGEEEWEGLWPL